MTTAFDRAALSPALPTPPTPSSAQIPAAASARPWGLRRLAPYPKTDKALFTSVTIDPDTQLGVFRNGEGHIVELGKHGTSSGTSTSTTTNLDSKNDTGSDQDSQQD
ncbi:putative ATP-grasp-modified RiPP [Streptomyces sp. NPDC002306]